MSSKISWTNETWNPTTGCDQVSPGCDHCYALTLAGRLKKMGQAAYQNDGDPKTSGPGFALTLHPDRLEIPLGWKKPRRVFVNSMSDLFHDDVPDEFIAQVFGVMAATPKHQFQILTKRPRRMMTLLNDGAFVSSFRIAECRYHEHPCPRAAWPLPNVWLGTSVEDQKRADLRVPLLMDTPAAVRFLSCEPLLGPVDLSQFLGLEFMETFDGWMPEMFASMQDRVGGGIHWIIAGGESGPGFRPLDPEWARLIRDQARAAEIPFFYKQGSGIRPEMNTLLDGREWHEFPESVDA